MVEAEARRKVLQEVEDSREEIVDLLAQMIRFKTPNPPGVNTLPAQMWMKERLEDLGFTVEMFDVFPGEPNRHMIS